MDQDFATAEEVVRADPEWRAAMARRGLDDVTRIRACPLTAGSFGFPGEDGRRLVRVLAFVQDDEHGYAWAHPVDGVAAYVDLVERRVIELVDEFVLPVPQESGDYDDPAVRGPHRTTLRPIEITQPEGPSFTLDGPAAALGGLVHADRLRRPRGADPAPDQRRRRRTGPAGHLPGVHPRDGGALRGPEVPVLADLFRHRRVPGREVGELARAGLRLPRRDRLPGRDGDR